MFKKINEGACNYKITGNIGGHDIEFIPADKYTTLLAQAERLADALDVQIYYMNDLMAKIKAPDKYMIEDAHNSIKAFKGFKK